MFDSVLTRTCSLNKLNIALRTFQICVTKVSKTASSFKRMYLNLCCLCCVLLFFVLMFCVLYGFFLTKTKPTHSIKFPLITLLLYIFLQIKPSSLETVPIVLRYMPIYLVYQAVSLYVLCSTSALKNLSNI